MATESALYTTWSAVLVGREALGLAVFQEAIAYYEKRKAAGKIADFRIGITELGAVSEQSGYMIAEGSRDQIQAIVDDEDFKRIVVKATHVVPFSISRCSTGTAIGGAVERLLAVRKELGII